MVDYVRRWNERTEIAVCTLVLWLGITLSKFHDWRRRYGKVNEHNAWIPRDGWLEDWEKQAIIRFSFEYPLEGALVQRVSVRFVLALSRETTAVFGTLEEATCEELPGASPCPPNRDHPKFRYPVVGLPGSSRPSCT